MKFLKMLYRFSLLLKDQFGFNIFLIIQKLVVFSIEYIRYQSLNRNINFSASLYDLLPLLSDKTSITPLDPVYFYQDCWAAQKIFQTKPGHHYDVGSSAKTIGILSQFVPITMVDIRPIELKLNDLFFEKGSITQLPFESNTIESISSLCVVEHIGLGRYGDPLDQFGSEKAISELIRVTKPGGSIYFSVPIEDKNKVYFNGHRAFEQAYIKNLFNGCSLIEEKYINDDKYEAEYKKSKGFSIGLFMFTKN
ncbi:MAG: DUF268 domain-containing protein [Bacteroidota bacterium]